MSTKGWKAFDRAVVAVNKKVGRTVDHFVRPRPKLRNGRPVFDLAFEELTTLPKKRR